ncbi:hypothetical protein B0H17DRAFT_1149069 [Mycena rosella]|uniref:Secreted protein n=1 Tax=Mycena rosella TaxID=1033263 RepID=A0AAD7C6F4_MYCRO|nr:hypothetical protein B0H17DRAFT_1149069 [Mycena rosella]
MFGYVWLRLATFGYVWLLSATSGRHMAPRGMDVMANYGQIVASTWGLNAVSCTQIRGTSSVWQGATEAPSWRLWQPFRRPRNLFSSVEHPNEEASGDATGGDAAGCCLLVLGDASEVEAILSMDDVSTGI